MTERPGCDRRGIDVRQLPDGTLVCTRCERVVSEAAGGEWICTFGFGHTLPDGTPLAGKFVRVRAATREDAHRVMYERYGSRWSMCYASEEAAGVAPHGLAELVEVRP